MLVQLQREREAALCGAVVAANGLPSSFAGHGESGGRFFLYGNLDDAAFELLVPPPSRCQGVRPTTPPPPPPSPPHEPAAPDDPGEDDDDDASVASSGSDEFSFSITMQEINDLDDLLEELRGPGQPRLQQQVDIAEQRGERESGVCPIYLRLGRPSAKPQPSP